NPVQVVGQANTASGASDAFLWQNGVMRGLGASSYAVAVAINDSGQVAGTSTHGAFLWQNGLTKDLGTLNTKDRGTPKRDQFSFSDAEAINASGQVVGFSEGQKFDKSGYFLLSDRYTAVVWSNGQIKSLGTLPGGSNSGANGINDLGQVVGTSDVTSSQIGLAFPRHGFLWNSPGSMIDLGTLAGLPNTIPSAINNSSQVVGWSNDATSSGASTKQRAFLWQNGIIQDLNSLVSAGSGWVLVTADAINA